MDLRSDSLLLVALHYFGLTDHSMCCIGKLVVFLEDVDCDGKVNFIRQSMMTCVMYQGHIIQNIMALDKHKCYLFRRLHRSYRNQCASC